MYLCVYVVFVSKITRRKREKKIKYCLPILHAINDRNLRNLPIRTSLPEIFEIELFGIWFGKKEQHTQTQSTNTIFLCRLCDNEQWVKMFIVSRCGEWKWRRRSGKNEEERPPNSIKDRHIINAWHFISCHHHNVMVLWQSLRESITFKRFFGRNADFMRISWLPSHPTTTHLIEARSLPSIYSLCDPLSLPHSLTPSILCIPGAQNSTYRKIRKQ